MRTTNPVFARIPGGGRYRQLPDGRYERLEGPELDEAQEEAPASPAGELPDPPPEPAGDVDGGEDAA